MKTRIRPDSPESEQQFGVYEAKTQLPRLLERVKRGEEIIITRHGHPVAKLVPIREPKRNVADTIAAIHAFRAEHGLKGISMRELINEGRRR